MGLHAAQRLDVLVDFVQSEKGRNFLETCERLGLDVEYELHAVGQLLSRELYYKDASLFRMDAKEDRSPDANCCPSSPQALELIAEKAVEYARILKPTTKRYFYWPDDGRDWCQCPKCRGLSASDQAALVENAMATALREHVEPEARLCHIAYHFTLEPPKQVTPHPALFVEFAPISRRYDLSIGARNAELTGLRPVPNTHGEFLDLLDANLDVFGKDSAQVLEYWLDVSKFSQWRRPAKELPWNPDVVRRDAAVYASRGIRHVTTFATWIDADYVARFGPPPLEEYVDCLKGT